MEEKRVYILWDDVTMLVGYMLAFYVIKSYLNIIHRQGTL